MARLERLEAARARALASLTTAAAGDSLCTLARERLPTAKYFEGAVAALGDAVRAARRDQSPPDADTWASWTMPLAERDANWRAYVVGGREALLATAG